MDTSTDEAVEDGVDARRRKVSTKADGSDLESNSARRSARAAQELAAEKRRKELQEYRVQQSQRRYAWQDRLERRSLAVEAEVEQRRQWGVS